MSGTRIRPVRDEDSSRLLTWRNRPDVARWMYSDHQITPEEHAQWFSKALCDPSRTYWVVEIDGEPAGLANLYDLDQRNRRAAWAYYLAEADARGRGVGAYVEFLVLEHVFVEVGLHKLWCEVLAGNEAVCALHRSFGFRQEALLRDHVVKDGAFVDVLGFGLLRDEWLGLRAASCARLRAKGHSAELRGL